MPIRLKLDLPGAIGRPGPWPAHRHSAAAECDLTALVTMPDRGAIRDVPALRANDTIDLGLDELVQHTEADTDAQRQQPLLRRAGQLTHASSTGSGSRSMPWSLAATDAVDTVLMR